MYQDLRAQLERMNPDIRVSGEPLDPEEPRPTLATVVQIVYVSLLGLMFFGEGAFRMLGIAPPAIYRLAQEHKVCARTICAYVHFFGGLTDFLGR